VAVVTFVEEMLPGLDVIPPLRICGLYLYFLNSFKKEKFISVK